MSLAVIVTAALYGTAGVANMALSCYVVVYKSAYRFSGSLASTIETVVVLLFLAYVIVRRVWFVMIRRALDEAHVDPTPVLNHPLMQIWRIGIAISFIANCLSVGALQSNPLVVMNVGFRLLTVMLGLVPIAVCAVMICAVIVIDRFMHALPPQAPRPPRWKPSKAELAATDWRQDRRF